MRKVLFKTITIFAQGLKTNCLPEVRTIFFVPAASHNVCYQLWRKTAQVLLFTFFSSVCMCDISIIEFSLRLLLIMSFTNYKIMITLVQISLSTAYAFCHKMLRKQHAYNIEWIIVCRFTREQVH